MHAMPSISHSLCQPGLLIECGFLTRQAILISMLVWLSFPTRVLSNLLSPSLAFSAQVWLSFLTFFFAADAIDVRLSVALTVILAINVYQIVLVDMMPATG